MELLIKKIKLAKRLFVLRKLGRCKILLIIATLFVYILLGSSTIFFFESNAHESYVRKIYLNIAVNRFVCILLFISSEIKLKQF